MNFPKNIELTNQYKGYTYMIIIQDMGFRCGYVQIPEGHYLYNKGYSEPIDALDGHTLDETFDVHGGITFASKFPREIQGYWIGFDCAHVFDGKDPKLMSKAMNDFYKAFGLPFSYEHEVVRSKDYVENTCKELIDQIVEKDNEIQTKTK